ncbi:MAG: DUF1636 family protein, partial [Delftia acidovorans]|nr:DUF1636 family protein [Delftia acidovorans]
LIYGGFGGASRHEIARVRQKRLAIWRLLERPLGWRDEDVMADETRPATPLPEATTSTSAAPVAAAYVALKSGLVIRHYVIEEVIGAGGFGITYRARQERLKSKVFALKEFFPREFAARSGTHVISTRDGEGIFRWGLDRFLKEAEALAKCEHPGIVDVVDYFEENGTAYAVLGYVEGQQLGHWADNLGRAPTQAELDRILMPLLDALEVVHGADLLHRDIAPDNILIRRDGSPCLIDFGACREDIRERSRKISAIVKHGAWSYVFGDLTVESAADLIEGATLFAGTADAILPWRGRPAALKQGLVARIPPVFSQSEDFRA